ncbi:MAG: peroxiredoxin family protein [Candidatus Aminicenantales bacterium]
MKKITMLAAAIVFLAMASVPPAAGQAVQPATVWQKMPDFSLPVFQGGEWKLSSFQGKNILLIFPRGLAGEGHWCHICNYQYADLVEWEKTKSIRKTDNLEIAFVLPYGRELVQDWVDKFPDQLKDIEKWKNPPETGTPDEKLKIRGELMRKNMPNSYLYEKGAVPLPFPILLDADRTVTKSLGIFTTEWGGAKIEQNVPTILIIDPQGIVQMKYISQNTWDRPPAAYLIAFIENMARLWGRTS